jgi:hypothetical protein
VSPKAWLFDFLKFATDLGAIVIAVTFWHIWEARNDAHRSTSLERSPVGIVVADIKFLAGAFSSVDFIHVHRSLWFYLRLCFRLYPGCYLY